MVNRRKVKVSRGKKAALHNLGCKVNAYELEAMQQMLEKAGYEIVLHLSRLRLLSVWNLALHITWDTL